MRGFRFYAPANMTVIHSAEFAQEARELKGSIPLSQLSRLADQLANTSGEVFWHIESGVDRLQRPWLYLEVTGTLQLVCQRCLSAAPWQLHSETVLTQFADEAQIDEAEALDEDLEGILIDPELDIEALVEDEILLALPVALTHDVCGGDDALAKLASDKPNPFAVLAQLKTRKAE
ncbi:YceD family protein [Chitinibacter sp. SCUT-21]|uniref:YceD family protein n=1 Tax=Chitinibacter sp. SCUT-21 TaxID=2970891 RepID=UPI0035A59E5E